MNYYRSVTAYLSFIVVCFIVLFFPYFFIEKEESFDPDRINVLTYSSFVQDWGPGLELAEIFQEMTGIKIRWINSGNAGLILERLRFKKEIDRPDIVLGFDQFSLLEARKIMKWRDVEDVYQTIADTVLPQGSIFHDFFAFDWGPMTFVYREGEVEPPKSFADLLDKKFAKKLIIQDPRISSPGLQFLFWVLQVHGEEKGFEYLRKLKKSIQVLAPSWSNSYSLFQVKKGSLVFSYFTSPLYHQVNEGRKDYRVAKFEQPHPVQVEYAGIPQICQNCEKAARFLKFLASPRAQKILMEKNLMFPMNRLAMKGSKFKLPTGVHYYTPIESWSMMRKKKEIVEKWKKVFY